MMPSALFSLYQMHVSAEECKFQQGFKSELETDEDNLLTERWSKHERCGSESSKQTEK